MPIHLTTFGGPTVRVGDSERVDLQTRNYAVLAYLGVERTATREAVADLLWPHSPPDKARGSLSTALSALRKALGDDWIEAEGREGLRATDAFECDAQDFAEAIEHARFREALTLFAGPFLGGLGQLPKPFEAWSDRLRARMDRLRNKAFKGVVDQHVGSGRLAAALEAAHKWVEVDPTDDAANYALVELLEATGSRAQALVHSEAFTELLHRELGVKPVDEFEELTRRIRSTGEAPLPVAATSPVDVQRSRELGSLQERFNDEFELLRPVGEGSMSTVYRARQVTPSRTVALKVIGADLAKDPAALTRFEREIQVLADVDHDHIPEIFRVGLLSERLPYMVMPYIDGVTLRERFDNIGPPPVPETRRLLKSLASALAATHARSVVHRDVRPGNVLYEEGTAKYWLLDFGIAALLESSDQAERLTRTNELLSQPGYVSPEQVRGDPVEGRTDVYSLAVMGITLLSGIEPTDGGEVSTSALEAAAQRDPQLTDILRPCLANHPRHRPHAAQLEQQVAGLIDGSPVEERSVFAGLDERRMPIIVGSVFGGSIIALGLLDQLVQNEVLPPVGYPLGLITALAGLAFALVASWFHGKPGKQPTNVLEVAMLLGIAAGWVVAVGWVVWG